MSRKQRILGGLLACLVVFGMLASYLPRSIALAWSNDPTQNTPICTASDNQESPQLISDGSGGAIMTWQDSRSGNADIYAQRVDSCGVVQWADDGVAICSASGDQLAPQLITDGSGGAIITWWDYRGGFSSGVYAQRVDSGGVVRWAPDGVAICTAWSDHSAPQIISDGSGGAIITWEDCRSGEGCDIYAQRVDLSGSIKWAAGGVAISTASGNQGSPQLTSDGLGGAIIAWQDYRSGNGDIYARRIDSAGTAQWTANGVAICTDPSGQKLPQLTSDGSGGAIVIWSDDRQQFLSNYWVYGQRIDFGGTVRWTTDGVEIAYSEGYDPLPHLISDESGGAIIAFPHHHTMGETYVIAAKVGSAGTVAWSASPDIEWMEFHLKPQLITDGSGGAIIVWQCIRPSNPSDWDIRGMRVDSGGTVQWTTNGVAICTEPSVQQSPQLISDGSGGAIIAWEDYRSGTSDIYSQRVDSDGSLTTAPAVDTVGAGVQPPSATLNGNLTCLGGTTSVEVSFEWGLTTSYGNATTPRTMTSTGAFSSEITGLTTGASYHFRAKAVGNGTAYGSDMIVIPQNLPDDLPVITWVSAQHDGHAGPTVIGTFISGIEANNTITAQAFGPDGSDDVARVTFAFDGQAPVDGAEGSEGWTIQQNMGNLAPGTDNLSVVAYDSTGLASAPYVIEVVMIDRPDWLKQDRPHILDTSAAWDATEQKYTLTATIPDPVIEYAKQFADIPFCRVLNNFFKAGFTVGADYWIDPDEKPPVFTASGTLETQILNQDGTPVKLNITGALAPDLSFASIDVRTETITIYERNAPLIRPKQVPIGIFGLTLNLRADLLLKATVAMEAYIDTDLTVECSIAPAVTCGGTLDASLGLWGVARLGVRATAAVELSLPVTYSTRQDPSLQAHPSLDIYIDYTLYWAFLWKSGNLAQGRLDLYSSETLRASEALSGESTSDSDTYLFSSPHIATDDSGNAMLVWIRDKNEGSAVPDPEVYYSLWNGNSWSHPAAITDNDRFETDPVVAYGSDGNAMAIWTQNKLTRTEAEPLGDNLGEILSKQEMFYARWNGSTWSVPQPITDNDQPDGLASIAALPNGGALATWVCCSADNVSTNTGSEIHYSVWDGSSWSTPASITNNDAADAAVNVASDQAGNAMAVWTHDKDGDLEGTIDDQWIYYSAWNGDTWTSPAAAVDNGESAMSPSIAFTREDNAIIAWVGGTDAQSRLYASSWDKNSGDWGAPDLVTQNDLFIHDPAVGIDSNNHLVTMWRGPGGQNGDIFYSVKDLGQSGSQWTEPKPLKSDDDMHWMPTAAMDSQGRILEVDSTKVERADVMPLRTQSLGAESSEGAATPLGDGLSFSLVSIGLDLALGDSDITFSNPLPAAGESIIISAAVHCTGGYEDKDAVVGFFDGDPDAGGMQIGLGQLIALTAGGGGHSASVQWEASQGHHDIYVVVDHSNAIAELDEANNRASRMIDVEFVPGPDDPSPTSTTGSGRWWLIGGIVGAVAAGGLAGGCLMISHRRKRQPSAPNTL